MNKTDSFVQNLSHWSNVISNVAISWQYITEQYDMRIARWYIAIDKCNFYSQLIQLFANRRTFQGGGYRGYSEVIEIVEKIYWENFYVNIFVAINKYNNIQ